MLRKAQKCELFNSKFDQFMEDTVVQNMDPGSSMGAAMRGYFHLRSPHGRCNAVFRVAIFYLFDPRTLIKVPRRYPISCECTV